MTLYLLLIMIMTFCLFINFKEKKARKTITILLFVILTTIAAIRSADVGVDTRQYYRNFLIIAKMDWSQAFSTRYEVGFFAFCKILSYISNNPQVIVIFSSALIIPIVGYFIYKESNFVVLSTLTYFLLNLYFFNLTGMRQSLAMSFIILSLLNYKNKKYFMFLINVVIASTFHSSALIFLLVPIIDRIKYNKKTLLYTLIIALLCFLFSDKLFGFMTGIIGKYSGYEDSIFGVSNYFGALIQSIFFSYIYIFCHTILTKHLNSQNFKENQFYLKLLGLAAIFEILSMKIQIFSRMALYFWFASIILIPKAIKSIEKTKNKFYMSLIIYLSLLMYWLIIAIYRPEWNGAVPYKTFFNNK